MFMIKVIFEFEGELRRAYWNGKTLLLIGKPKEKYLIRPENRIDGN